MCASKIQTSATLAFVLSAWACLPAQRPPEPRQPASAGASQATPSTIAAASAACDRVQQNSEVPVSCTTQYIDDVPSMIVGFRDDGAAREWMGAFAQYIGNPFCDAANRNGRQARVYMTVGIGAAQKARMWSCELGKWSDWFATAPAPEAPATPAAGAPETIADAIRLC